MKRGLFAFAVVSVFFAMIAMLAAPTESFEKDARMPASGGRLPPVARWERVAAFPLAGPTGHPQGLNITRDRLYLSAEASGEGVVNVYRLSRTDGRITAVPHEGTLSFAGYSGLTHAGGLGRSADRSTIYVPVAAKPFGKTVIIAIGPQGTREVAWFPFHIGTLFVDPGGKVLRAIGFDQGAHFEIFGNTVYTVDLATGERVSSVTPSSAEAFQDCKPIGDSVLCSDKTGSNLFGLRGSVDIVKFAVDGSYRVIAKLPVPHVNLDGSFGAAWGPYIPGVLGTPPLTYNAFDFEWSADRKSLYFYFVPNDFPDTHLYVYKLVLE